MEPTRLLSPEEQLEEFQTPEHEWNDSPLAKEVREFVLDHPHIPRPFAVLQPVDSPSIYLMPHCGDELAHECVEHDAVEVILVLDVTMAVEKHEDRKDSLGKASETAAKSPTMQFVRELEGDGLPTDEIMDKARHEMGMQDRILVSRNVPVHGMDWFRIDEHDSWLYSENLAERPTDGRNPFFTVTMGIVETLERKRGLSNEELARHLLATYQKSKDAGRGWNSDRPMTYWTLTQMVAVVEGLGFRLVAALTGDDLMEQIACQKLYRTARTLIAGGIGMFQELLADDSAFDKTLRGYSPQGRARIRESLTGRMDRLSRLLAKVSERYEKHGTSNN